MKAITKNEQSGPSLSCFGHLVLRLRSLGWLHALAGGLLLGGLACDGVLPGAAPADQYRFNEDIDAALAAMPAAEPDHAAPYIGPLVARSGEEVGTLLMSSCGCGFWRGLVEIGSNRDLVRLDFPEFPDSFSSFNVAEGEPLTLDGAFIEEGAAAFGELVASDTTARFRADRLEGEPTKGCVMCHVGEDPPRPLPDVHRIVDANTDCLACHEIAAH